MIIIKTDFNINIKSVIDELLCNALDASKILHGGEICERTWYLYGSTKLLNKIKTKYNIEKDEYNKWVTINGIQIYFDELPLSKEVLFIRDGYTTISEIIFIKPFRLYKVLLEIPTLLNFNSNNDIIPWIQHKFNKIKNKIFKIEVIEEESFIHKYFWKRTRNYNIYK